MFTHLQKGRGIMSRKHNTKHERGKSRYPGRLAARGLVRSPRMASLDDLRKWQA